MLKKVIAPVFALALMVCLFCFFAVSANAAVSGDYVYSVSGGKATITAYTGKGGNVTIPSKLGKYPVTAIGDSAFMDKDLTAVTIPAGITKIGDRAFASCYELNKVSIPEGVTSIGEYAFSLCQGLTDVRLPDSLKSIGEGAFYLCDSLTTVNIPAGIKSIAAYTFEDCSALRSLILPDGIISIGEYAFNHCESLSELIIPTGVSSVGEHAFAYCYALRTVSLPSGITSVSKGLFYRCYGLVSVTFLGDITSIGDFAFYDCAALHSVAIPGSVTAIGKSAFEWCKSMTYVALGDGVKTIGERAFYGCEKLKNVCYCGTKTDKTNITISSNNGSLNNATWYYYCTPLAITVQPKSVCVKSGETAKVTFKVTGDQLTYKWYFKNAGDSKFSLTKSYKSNSYSLKMDESRRDRQVYCVISDKYGNSITTDTVTLYIEKPLKITRQPMDVCVNNGDKATIKVIADGNGLTYRWYYKDVNDADYTYTASFVGNTYSLPMTDARAGRRVLCRVYDVQGNVVRSQSVVLYQVVRISDQPQHVCVNSGEKAVVKITAVGDGLNYRWYYKNAGDTSYTYTSTFTGDTYSVTMNDARAGRRVYCRVYDLHGNVVKSETVLLAQAAMITKQPVGGCVANGEKITVKVIAKGDGLTYRWYYKDAGASSYTYTATFTGNTYTVTMTDARAGRRVLCRVYDKYGNVVKSQSVVLNQAVRIVEQPATVKVSKGSIAAVSVTAKGDGLTYEWYFKNPGDKKFTITDAFTDDTYSVTMTSSRNGRQIYCIITDKYGNSVISNIVTLKMK